MKKTVFAVLCLALFAAPALHASDVDVGAYVRQESFRDIKLSPTGEYYATSVPLEDRTILAIVKRADNKVVGRFALERNNHVSNFDWVNPERVVISVAQKFGLLDEPSATGELFTLNTNGKSDILVGYRVQSAGPGTKIQAKKVEDVFARLVDDLPHDDKYVIISTSPFNAEAYTQAERLDVGTGHRVRITSAPVRRAEFITDAQGVVRFASGRNTDNAQQLYYRNGDGDEWTLINDENVSGSVQLPLGFSEDGKVAYLQVEQASGPDKVVARDVATGAMTPLLADDDTDPQVVLYRNASSVPVGLSYMDGRPRTAFFDTASHEAKLYRSLEQAFGGDPVRITSSTSDGKIALVQTWSDRNPGDFFLFDTVAMKAEHLLSRSDWVDPERMGTTTPISLPSRDGLTLHGYLTRPVGATGALPMVVMPHGGPFGVRDDWGFDRDVQILANAGYAVLQVNFRGSTGYGRAFNQAGARQWGGKMQDDLTDATRWAIAQGHTVADKICIYGASYGAYAALMGVAKEPGLYKCAVGYVGLYDLPMRHSALTRASDSGATFANQWMGDAASLAAVSPNRMADRIKVPVFLAAGGEDEITPIAHSEKMEAALRAAGVPVETLYVRTEGHGFYKPENRQKFYTQLLAFLSRSLGGGVASTSPAGGNATAR
ncbi:alpha/beta hydrolase family protein [Montanilutibacter psychrotolerans]|uniref:S9 family peptidase n=1 Tax=Montanilutibacter psychrotolerans TaxID=1327343 RepID=A0A3M8T5V8_9GAMM|nr:S9 family peptidase [Lysobacter psychrotolerans]RNF86132.1 S9 family peptidase [Lysobacter psychrotolerans]